jgi:hypothetical protein
VGVAGLALAAGAATALLGPWGDGGSPAPPSTTSTTAPVDVVGELATGFVRGADGALTPAEGTCVAERFVAELGPDALVDLGITPVEKIVFGELEGGVRRAFVTAATACLPAETVGVLVERTPGSEPTTAVTGLPGEPGG